MASDNGRIPHACLFSGPEGNGALTLALALISYMLCQNKTENDSCGECSSCSKTGSFIHPDVHFSYPFIAGDSSRISDTFLSEWRSALKEMPFLTYTDWMDTIKGKDDQNKQGNITAEECRNILKKLSLRAFEGGKKFMVLWLPEYLGQAGNILLKVLEEPSENTHFFIVTEKPDKVLNTIISRTQIFPVPQFKTFDVHDYLLENFQCSSEDAELHSFLSEGNLSLAIKALNEGDSGNTEELRNWMMFCYTGNMIKINEWVNTMSSLGRERIKNFLRKSLYTFNECLHLRLIEGYKPKVPSGNQKFVSDFSKLLTEPKLEEIYKAINDTIYHIDRNANPRISLTNVSLTIRRTLMSKTEAV